MNDVLLLSTIHLNHASRSGYQLLADYLPEAEFLSAPRVEPTSAVPLFAARVARKFAFSRWYLGGCAALEWKALRRLRAGFEGVVHSLWAVHDLGYLDLVLNRKRQRLCGTFHNCDDTFQHTIRFPHRLRRFDAIILMSETQRPFFLRAGVVPEKIHVVLHGVDTNFFTPPENIPNEEEFVVLSVGGYRRNFPLLRAVCGQMRAVKNVRFEIVAPKSWRDMFAGLPNVRFFSGLDDEQLLEKYRASSCFLQTAENATANNSLLEAMSCGLPVVTERVGGIPEYVNGNSAVLTPANDANALANAIRGLAASHEIRAAMGRAARARAEELDWKNVATWMREIYR